MASASSMKDLRPGAIALGSIATMSGYLLVVSSELREKILGLGLRVRIGVGIGIG